MLKTLAQSFSECWMGAIKGSYYLLMCSDQQIQVHHPDLIATHTKLAKYFATHYDILPEWIAYGLLSTNAFALLGDNTVPVNTLDKPTLEFEIARLRKRGIEKFKQRLRGHIDLADLEQQFQPVMDWNPVDVLLHAEELHGKSSITSAWKKVVSSTVPNYKQVYKDEKLHYYASYARTAASADAYHKYGLELAKRRRCQEAIEQYRLALTLNPSRNNTYFNIGSCYEKLHNYALAIENYMKEAELDPDDEDAPFRMGRAYLKLERYHDALNAIDRAIAMEPDRSQSYVYRGMALLGLDSPDEAKTAFQNALDRDPKNKDARRAMEKMGDEGR